MKVSFLTCFSLLLLLLWHPARAQHQFKVYTIDDGLAQSQVYSVCQDSRGNLWIGTYGGGVSKYDGKKFIHYTTKNGLSNNIIYSIIEDSKGNMWFGTDGGGVCKYDGTNFTNVTTEQGLNNNHVYAIEEDSQGNLWFGTLGGISICHVEDTVMQIYNVDTTNGLVSNAIHSILEDSKGNIWFGTDGGISMLSSIENKELDFNNLKWSSYTAKNDSIDNDSQGSNLVTLNNNVVYSIIEDHRGNLLFGTSGGGINVLTPDNKWRYFTTDNNLCKDEITCMFEDKEGNLWIGTYGQGICKLIGGVNVISNLKSINLNEKDGLPNNIIWAITQDNSGNIWAGTEGGGLVKYLGENFTHFSSKNGIENDVVFSIIEDSKGNIWFGSNGGGLSKLQRTNDSRHGVSASASAMEVTTIATNEVLENDMVITLLEDKNGKIWIGTSHGVCIYQENEDGKQLTHFDEFPELNNNFILSIFEDKSGTLWFGTDGNGVIKIDPNKINQNDTSNESAITVFNTDNGLLNDIIWTIDEDWEGNIWLGTWGGGVSRLIPQQNGEYQIENITKDDGLADNFILSILKDPFGNIWFGTYGEGISVIVNQDNIKYSKNRKENVAFIQKNKSKLPEIEQKEKYNWLHLNTENGLVDDGIVSMTFDAMGNLWVGTNSGINKISNIELGLEHPELIKIQQYGKLEGFTGIECNQNAICKDHWGDIWFGTANYVSRYNSWADDFNTVEPETHITGLKLFFEEEDWSKYAEKVNTWDHLPSNLTLTYEKNHLTFDFVGISLKIPEKVRYQYMLEGLDDNWSPPSTQTFATYPQLPPGDYTFTVKACNNDGLWNKEPARFQFVITPPFWKTIWFYTLCIGAIVSLIYITVRLRIRNLQRAKKLLKQQVKLRTNQLRKEKILVERQKGELEIAYNKLKDLENFKQSLMGMIVHDLKNPLNSILAFSNYEPAKDVLRNIGQAGKQMLNLVLNILDVQKFEDTAIKLNIETLQIYRLAKEAINQTIHLAEQKEISLTVEIDQNTTVKAEEEIIIRILVNLLTNAIKYTPTRGKIIISSSILESNEVMVRIQDSGIGIASDKLDTIFDRFAQVESKDSGQVTSTGLGLTFCKMAIEAHKGIINVESEVGKGTTFSFSLPLGEEIEIEIIDENQKEPKEKNKIKLGKKEKEIIASFVNDFSVISVYHTSENISILNQIQADDNAIISSWKKEVELAVYNCNEEKYMELLKLLE